MIAINSEGGAPVAVAGPRTAAPFSLGAARFH
jgi:hypothetical protein